MNGPEHYREAERLLELAENTDWTVSVPPAYRDVAHAAALVHAQLAQVAATIEHGLARGRQGFDVATAWTDAIYATPRGEQP